MFNKIDCIEGALVFFEIAEEVGSCGRGDPSVQGKVGGVQTNLAGAAGGGVGAPGATQQALSAELVGEVESVLGKLMSSLQHGDPSLIPLITSLQMSLKVGFFNIQV